MPAVLIVHPEKATTPEVSVPKQPDRAPGPPEVGVPVVMARVTVEESVVTVLPPASWTVTLGWVAKAVPPVELDGCWVKASWAVGPKIPGPVNEAEPLVPLVPLVPVPPPFEADPTLLTVTV